MYCKVYIGIFIGVLNTGMSSFQGGWIRGGALIYCVLIYRDVLISGVGLEGFHCLNHSYTCTYEPSLCSM